MLVEMAEIIVLSFDVDSDCKNITFSFDVGSDGKYIVLNFDVDYICDGRYIV